jgi:hypothetical protein
MTTKNTNQFAAGTTVSPEKTMMEIRRWRVCLLILKSKLEAVATNAKLFDVELLPYFVMPDGKTVAQRIDTGRLDQLYEGKTQLLLGPAPAQGANA